MNRKKYAARLIFSLLISLLVIYPMLAVGIKSTSFGIFYVFGGAMFSKNPTITSVVFGMLPLFLLCFSLADYMLADFSSCCVYIFTRSKSRFSWVAKKTSALFVWITIFYLSLYILAFIFMRVLSVPVDFGATVSITLWSLFLNILNAFAVLLPSNLIAVRFGSVISFISCMSAYIVLLCATIYSPPQICVLLPFSQCILAIHKIPFTAQQAFSQISPLPGFFLIFSVIYLFAVISAELFISFVFIKKADILSAPEGEK